MPVSLYQDAQALARLRALAPFTPAPAPAEAVLSLLTALRRTEGEALHRLAAVHARGDLAAEGWTGSVAGWLIARAGMSRPRAMRWQQAATQLPHLPATAKALVEGRTTLDHTAPIFKAAARGHREALTERLAEPVPTDHPPHTPVRTLDELLADLAVHESPSAVDRAVKELLNRLDPEREAAAYLRRQERRHLQLTPTLDGTWHVEGLLDAMTGTIVHNALDTLMRPEDAADPRTPGQRRTDALRTLAESPRRPSTPRRPTAVITIAHQALTTAVRSLPARRLADPWADLEGAPIPVPTARRLACDAELIPAVLATNGRVLDVGRTHRLITRAQRTALAVEQPTCMYPGCTIGWRTCEAHHIVPWSEGGPTDLANLVHLCGRHHDAVHTEAWTVRRAESGRTAAMVWTGSAGERLVRPLPRRGFAAVEAEAVPETPGGPAAPAEPSALPAAYDGEAA